MKRIILVALVGVLVSWPATAAEDDAVLLHCNGVGFGGKNNAGKEHPISNKNVVIARDGNWINWLVAGKIPRTEKTEVAWTYEYVGSRPKRTIRIDFLSKKMEMLVYDKYEATGESFVYTYACFPIENPLKF